MAIGTVSRTTINLILIAVMAVCLVVALIAGTLAIAWVGQPEGGAATTTAETFAWLFAAAFFATFAIALFEQHEDRRTAGRMRRVSTP